MLDLSWFGLEEEKRGRMKDEEDKDEERIRKSGQILLSRLRFIYLLNQLVMKK